ncbi:hypothetical protein SAMN04487949_3195 [Halogranum gelatinilyticum]|uniref:Uncharacterized protein n=1 Tax=Halogranum gelatinilyticum TaxID=660521 RepID=A0A1G9Y0G0_9EURY|nr:hypothetical protein [Halogranum gelatinilyticum]SDN02131.1 hypothetical protein SAMN04487949_3195 [Halogranum gelatinilyticum]
MDPEELETALEAAFGGTAAERRVVARQARDLADSGTHEADRGRPLTVEEIVENLADAPEGTSLPSRWNWWLGALDVAYGGYREFQIERVPRE